MTRTWWLAMIGLFSLLLATYYDVTWTFRRKHEDRSAEFIGATEDWSPAREVMTVGQTTSADRPAPDWDADTWGWDVHAALNAMMDNFQHDVDHIWNGVYDRLGIDGRTRSRLISSAELTGEMPIVKVAA